MKDPGAAINPTGQRTKGLVRHSDDNISSKLALATVQTQRAG